MSVQSKIVCVDVWVTAPKLDVSVHRMNQATCKRTIHHYHPARDTLFNLCHVLNMLDYHTHYGTTFSPGGYIVHLYDGFPPDWSLERESQASNQDLRA